MIHSVNDPKIIRALLHHSYILNPNFFSVTIHKVIKRMTSVLKYVLILKIFQP